MKSIQEIAQQLVLLCKEGKYDEAQNELYAEDVVSIECPMNGERKESVGLPAIRQKAIHWEKDLVELHSSQVGEPVVADSAFAVTMALDGTFKSSGRMSFTELAVYVVKDGKIVREQFFY